ncbi:MAG: DUF2344 domain-containing protein [Thermoleophilia bacterium]|nr:DUF2344 domain-containing protein [Thermoleophilia bacterium]
MSKTAGHRFEDILAEVRQPARLTGGEWGAGPGFGGDPHELRVVLGFPDTYEIGISNQAVQILYHVAAGVKGVGAERVCLPWVDALAAMRRLGVPLLTLETWTPVIETDLFAVTLQHEFNYTNLLEMLDLAGIAVRAEERTDEQPLVLAGGPACADFVPLSRFLDAVAVGDGEELFAEILAVLREAKKTGATRAEKKRALAGVEGVYVPGLSNAVTRRVIDRLEGAPYPETCLVPLTAGVHDRAWIEIMRGCTRGCRFCQAGMWYRPVRERSPGEILRMAETQLRSTGHQELAFASLSTTDYSRIEELLAATATVHPEVRVSLPSLRVDSAAVRLAGLASPTGPSLTLAPEAGSQRMRDIINKNVAEDDVMAAAAEAFGGGRTTLKLYFMIGLPFEEDEDVIAIADLCLKIRELGRSVLGARAGRLQLNISVNNFVPKPFTPFQWAGMAGRKTLLHRQDLLRSRLRRPGIKSTLHGVDKSYLEAALARGDESLGSVIEGAWRRGARFDSWTEQFREDAWRAAFEEIGTSAEALATATLPDEAALPWDVIQGVVDRSFLRSEWHKAGGGGTTGDCRWTGCCDCGACEIPASNDLAASFAAAPEAGCAAEARRSALPGGAAAATAGGPAAPAVALAAPSSRPDDRLRYVATFSVTGRDRYIGHLDRVEVFRRAVRRAGGRLALSAGMRPKPLLSLALPLAVGVEGLREYCGFELAEEPPADFAARLAASLPVGTRFLSLERYDANRSLPARVVAASYEVRVGAAVAGSVDLDAVMREAGGRFATAASLPIEEIREGRVHRVDVRSYVERVEVTGVPGGGCTVSFKAAVTPDGTARPERVVEALGTLCGVVLEIDGITRTQVHLS